MEEYRCFEPDCMLNVEYACICSSSPVYNCKAHAFNHLEVPNKDHVLKSIFEEPFENTWEAIPLPKCDSIEDFNNKFKEGKIQRNISIEKKLKEKSEVLESSISLKLERKLKSNCLACESDLNVYEKSVTQGNQDIASNYQQKPFLFNILEKYKKTNLLIYNTEIESLTSIILDTPEPLSRSTCITQLPNGKLFCFGHNYPYSGITLLIDEDYRVQELTEGTPCSSSSAIYFNNNVYCFGGWYNGNSLTFSSRFDLDRNQWNNLTPLPNADYLCNSVIFNGNILISGYKNKNILRYSIDSNSFLTIPYEFADYKKKILINTERLYLIECDIDGSIYESEIGSCTAWRQIKNSSRIDFDPDQTNCQYNKEEIYIGGIDWNDKFFCWKFNLNEKRLIKLV